MAWNISERFPSWGETGEFPAAGFFYEGGDQVNEKHMDALWNGINGLEEDVQAALNDIDSDADGAVDRADGLVAGGTLDGDLVATDGEVVWDESAGYVPQGRLQNDSLTFAAGDGLKGGGTVSLGGSATLNIEPADFAGEHLSDDGSDNLAVDDDFILNSGDTMSGILSMGENPLTGLNSLRVGGSSTYFSIEDDANAVRARVDKTNGNVDIEGELTEGSAL